MGLLDALRDPRFRSDLATNAGQLGQSMSNTIAEGATVPVDALAWLLRKGGVNVPQNPIGGSDWAKQQGLMADVPAGAPKIVGETLGLLAPMAATKQGASKIAGGLLDMGENLARPRTMNPQTGAIVWHGSPHKFDKFDSAKIGTGEGAQAYGHGLYLAESPDVAKSYQNLKPITDPTDGGFIQARAAFDAGKGDAKKAIGWLDNRATQIQKNAQFLTDKGAGELSQIARAKQLLSEGAFEPGTMYKVDLPDDQIAKMLDWELPLSQQPDAIQNIARSADIRTAPGSKASGIINAWREGRDVGVTAKGGDLHHAMTNFGKADPLAFAELLRSRGIPGIRYLDEGSRNIGKGTSNFVVFPGNENMLRILERNGQPMGLLK